MKYLTTFNSPPIQFKRDDSYYLGNQDTNSLIYINPDGRVYIDKYKIDFVDNYVIFIDEKGNYYKSNFKKVKV